MGASASSEQAKASAEEQREVETLAASTGALPMLRKAFSNLALSSPSIPLASLQKCFSLKINGSTCDASLMPKNLPGLLDQLGPSIVDVFFVAATDGVGWVEFVKGYVRCCGRISSSMMFNNLLRVFATATEKAGFPSKLHFKSEEEDCKISGSLLSADLLMLLLTCWIVLGSSRVRASALGQENMCLPDIDHLALSALLSCTNVIGDLNLRACNISDMNVEIPVGEIHTWALKTAPHLGNCFTQFVHARLQYSATAEDLLEPSSLSLGDISLRKICDTHLLTCGRAWAVFLTLSGAISEEILKVCFPSGDDGANESLLYRSSLDGKGLNRFWSKVEGYRGALLILISSKSECSSESNGSVQKWIIGVLMLQSFENRDAFYGSSGNLYAISPVFNTFFPSGREKNFVYSRLHPTGRVYEPHPKPVGIAFGGNIGNERIFLDEDFDRITIRHHAADKTYGHGSLIPNQGFQPVEALVSEVEVWGLGGRTAMETQAAYKNREQLFTEQRRKVDLKTFGCWEDSPEKMMMDMVSDPNRAGREDR